MKAVILAGGRGTRAKPFTDHSPKPMIPIDGRPTIDYVVRYLAKFSEIDKIIIICNFEKGGNQIKNYFDGKDVNEKIIYVEDNFEGTGGALLKAKENLKDEDEFLVWFGDNLCPIDLKLMIKFHKEKGGIGSIAVSKRKREETGHVKLDGSNLILEFKEKPTINLKDPECLAVYIFNKKILDYIEKEKEKKKKVNLSFDILQKLPSNEKIFAFDIGDLGWSDVESTVKVERNIHFIKAIIKQMKQ